MGRNPIPLQTILDQNPWGRLTVIGEAPRGANHLRRVRTRCACTGVQKDFDLVELTRKEGFQRSCGCLKKEAHARRIELEMISLPLDTHFEIWEAAQGNNKDSSQRNLVKRFGFNKYLIGSIVATVGSLVQTFLSACAEEEWATLAQQTRTAMANHKLEYFGFGQNPRSAADKLFLFRIVDRAVQLREDHYIMNLLKEARVRSMFDLIEWVIGTRQWTLDKRTLNKAAGALRAAEGIADQRSQGKTIEQQK